MFTPATELVAAGRLAIALLIGAGVGLEREWSGHSSGPRARFAGLRTFVLLGVCGGIAGVLLSASEIVAATIIAGSLALTVAAYVLASTRPEGEVGGTTEAAALLVTGLGVLAGSGYLALAAGAGALVVLVLREKTRLHWLVRRVSEHELRATLQFAVLALVVLPLLPEGPIGGAFGLRPREVWILVLIFSGINFGAYLIRRAIGPEAGYVAAGLAGGLVSSTAITLEFSRRSRREPGFAHSLAFGTIGASTVLVPRVIVLSALLNTGVARSLAAMLWLPTAIGATIVGFEWRRQRGLPARRDDEPPRNPLRLRAAVQMAVAFQVALSALALVRERWGTGGVYATATLLGLTDVDALTMSMSRLDGGWVAEVAAQAIVIGILANTALKLALGATLGEPTFRRRVVAGLGALGATTALSLAMAWQ